MDDAPSTVLFALSGHGFGHATRSLQVAAALGARVPGARLVVRSALPSWFLEAARVPHLHIEPASLDVGMVQLDSLRIDEGETARRAAAFYGQFESHVAREVAAIERLRPTVIVGDIPPVAFAAAARAGVPSVALGNFTWDWIYEAYPDFARVAPGAIETIRTAYGTATRALRLPFHGGFAPMAAVTRDIPLIARKARHSRGEARRLLDLDDHRPVVLASFGGHGLKLPYAEIASRGDFTLVLTDHEAAGAHAESRLRSFTFPDLARRGLQYADLVAASDVVVSKPGFGIVSECIANGAALLYTSRGRFPEHDVFVAEMPAVVRCRYLPQEDLVEGRWAEAIRALLDAPPPAVRPRLDGDRVAADEILELAYSANPAFVASL
jgi:L-arabinokinase